MRPTVSTGDLALAAQPASVESFQPYGCLLDVGERAYLGKRGRVLVAVDRRKRGPRRVAHLQRYPEARRAYIPSGPAPSWIVVLRPGEESSNKPAKEPAAFLLPAGRGVIIDAGVWHAGPVPLDDMLVTELLETIGTADRFDRRSLRDLAAAEAVRVLLPEEPGGPPRGIDLSAPNAVLLDASLHGRLRLGCLLMQDLAAADVGPELAGELERAVGGLRSMWGHAADLGQIPGIAIGRDLYREAGLDREQFVPPSEALVGQVLAGQELDPADALAGSAALYALRTRASLALYDAGALGDQLVVRTGGPGESYAAQDGRAVALEGRPLLADATGAFGSPLGDADRARVGPRTLAALAVFYLPRTMDDVGVEALLDGLAEVLTAHAGGQETARLIVG